MAALVLVVLVLVLVLVLWLVAAAMLLWARTCWSRSWLQTRSWQLAVDEWHGREQPVSGLVLLLLLVLVVVPAMLPLLTAVGEEEEEEDAGSERVIETATLQM